MEEPDFSRFTVILCRAEEPGNVGSVCRAMKTMGLKRLALAACPEYDEQRLRMMAVHAADLFDCAERFPSLDQALAPQTLAAGFTRRRGERRKAFSLSIADFVERFCFPAGSTPQASARVALVFGNERTGLTEDELSLCSLAVHIPTSSAFPSLNLAQAVQVAAWELRRGAIGDIDGSAQPAARLAVDESVERLAGSLRSLGFFKLTDGDKLLTFIRDTITRAGHTDSELRYFEALFQKMASLARRAGPGERR